MTRPLQYYPENDEFKERRYRAMDLRFVYSMRLAIYNKEENVVDLWPSKYRKTNV